MHEGEWKWEGEISFLATFILLFCHCHRENAYGLSQPVLLFVPGSFNVIIIICTRATDNPILLQPIYGTAGIIQSDMEKIQLTPEMYIASLCLVLNKQWVEIIWASPNGMLGGDGNTVAMCERA
jgi:hypothetical protein